MRLSCRKKEVKEQSMHTSTNISKRDKAQINWFRDKIAEAI